MDETEKMTRPDDKKPYKPGEKGFAVFLLLVGLFFTWQSWLLYQKAPGASSYGAVPLFCSCVIDVMAILSLFADRKQKTENTGFGIWKVLKNTFTFLFSPDILVSLMLVGLYCAALYLGAGFLFATPVFLWVGMTYLCRGNYLKNILWTALCMAFIYLIFRVLFSVVLP